jgi:SHS2 domain-containing protein
MKYTLIDHTADLGIHVFGSSPKELFTNAAHAMIDQITDSSALKGSGKHRVCAEGADWTDLMVNWLRETLFLWTGKEILVKTVSVYFLSEQKILADLRFDRYAPNQHIIKTEIKAVTYHQAEVNRTRSGWEAKIIFDV